MQINVFVGLLFLSHVHSYLLNMPMPLIHPAFRAKTINHDSLPSLRAIIYAESIEESYDEGLGGVRLAQESAIVLKGSMKGSGPSFTEMTRYTQVTELKRYIKSSSSENHMIPSFLENTNMNLICTGTGIELYQDPGDTAVRNVILAPIDAVEKALLSSTSTQSLNTAKKIFINFMGGDDLMIHEVIDAVERIVQGLDITSTSRVTFHSLCHSDFPPDKASVTVLSLNGESKTETSSEFSESIERGEIYFHEGKWWTTLAENINHAVA